MKKKIAFLIVALLIMALAGGCKKEQAVETQPASAPTEELKATEVPVVTEEPAATEEPAVTDEPEVTDAPEITDVPEEPVYTYEDIIGDWYLYSSEIEGCETLATDENENCVITFNEDHTAHMLSSTYYGPREEPYTFEVSGDVFDLPADNYWGTWNANFEIMDCEYYYFMNSDGNLIQLCDIAYDEGSWHSVATGIFVREQQVFAPEPLIVPADVQEIMDGAGEDNWVTVIAAPSAEMSAELDAAGWELHDETDNEWLSYPITNPVELIVCNTSDRFFYVQIHDPRDDYDPTSSDTGWVRGSFMYFDNLNPGEIARFIVNMPDDPTEAKMALYMFFDGEPEDEPYYMRIYRYPFNYLKF